MNHSMKSIKLIGFIFVVILFACSNNTGTNFNNPIPNPVNDDTLPPVNTTQIPFINAGGSNTSSQNISLSISATDNIGVTAYYASESAQTPNVSTAGWITITSVQNYTSIVQFVLSSGDGNKTIYVRFRDKAGNISSPAMGQIMLKTVDEATPIIISYMSITYVQDTLKIYSDEKAIDASLAAQGLFLSGAHVTQYKANIVKNMQDFVDLTINYIVQVSTTKVINKPAVSALLTTYNSICVSFVSALTTAHLASYSTTIKQQTNNELTTSINNMFALAKLQLEAL